MPGNVVSATLRGGLFTRLVGQRVRFFQETTSTMDEVRHLAQSEAPEGTAVIAETQTGGRGRFQRQWVSPPGNLYLSLLFRPTMQHLPLLNILGGVAVARAIRRTTRLAPAIKWPNDVLVNGKKVAGILVESAVAGDRVCYAALGIGINVALQPDGIPELAGLATSLNTAAGRKVSREELLRHLLQDIDTLYLDLLRNKSPSQEWKALLLNLGQRVTVTWHNETHTGMAEGVDELGNLLLRQDNGQIVTLAAGDVTLSLNARAE